MYQNTAYSDTSTAGGYSTSYRSNNSYGDNRANTSASIDVINKFIRGESLSPNRGQNANGGGYRKKTVTNDKYVPISQTYAGNSSSYNTGFDSPPHPNLHPFPFNNANSNSNSNSFGSQHNNNYSNNAEYGSTGSSYKYSEQQVGGYRGSKGPGGGSDGGPNSSYDSRHQYAAKQPSHFSHNSNQNKLNQHHMNHSRSNSGGNTHDSGSGFFLNSSNNNAASKSRPQFDSSSHDGSSFNSNHTNNNDNTLLSRMLDEQQQRAREQDERIKQQQEQISQLLALQQQSHQQMSTSTTMNNSMNTSNTQPLVSQSAQNPPSSSNSTARAPPTHESTVTQTGAVTIESALRQLEALAEQGASANDDVNSNPSGVDDALHCIILFLKNLYASDYDEERVKPITTLNNQDDLDGLLQCLNQEAWRVINAEIEKETSRKETNNSAANQVQPVSVDDQAKKSRGSSLTNEIYTQQHEKLLEEQRQKYEMQHTQQQEALSRLTEQVSQLTQQLANQQHQQQQQPQQNVPAAQPVIIPSQESRYESNDGSVSQNTGNQPPRHPSPMRPPTGGASSLDTSYTANVATGPISNSGSMMSGQQRPPQNFNTKNPIKIAATGSRPGTPGASTNNLNSSAGYFYSESGTGTPNTKQPQHGNSSPLPPRPPPPPQPQKPTIPQPSSAVPPERITMSQQVPKKPKLKDLLTQMRKGTNMVKYGRNGAPAHRFVQVRNMSMPIEGVPQEVPFLVWEDWKVGNTKVFGKKKDDISRSVPLIHLLQVIDGATTKHFKFDKEGRLVGPNGETCDQAKAMTLVFRERALEFFIPDGDEFYTWCNGMKLVLEKNQKLEKGR